MFRLNPINRRFGNIFRSFSSRTNAKYNYYDILGADRADNEKELKRKYRKLAKKYHPDAGASDSKKFQEINEAWEVLKDEKSRKIYDDLGHENYVHMKETGQDPRQAQHFGQGVDINDLFSDLFGGGFSNFISEKKRSRSRMPQQGEDLHLSLELSFEEAIKGTTKSLSYSRLEKCSDCSGSGVHKNEKPKTKSCSDCNGTGIRTRQMGFMIAQETCNTCEGSGEKIINSCSSCSGSGRIKSKTTIDSFAIPPGVDEGSTFKKLNGGNVGTYGGQHGNLVINLIVQKDKTGKFVRRGLDIYGSVSIPLVKSLLGYTASVNTPLDDDIEVKIKPGTLHGTTLRLKHKGVKYGSKVGDFYLKLLIQPLDGLSPRQKELLEELDEEETKKQAEKISEVSD